MEPRPAAITVAFYAIAFAFGAAAGMVLLWLLGWLWWNESTVGDVLLVLTMVFIVTCAVGAAIRLSVSPLWTVLGIVSGFGAAFGWLVYAFRDFGE